MKSDYLKYIGSLLLFGSNGIVAACIDAPSYEIVLLRSSFGAIFLFVLLAILRRKMQLFHSLRDLALVAGSGVALGVCWVFVYMAYREVGVGITSLLYAMGPVLVMAASPLLFGERLSVPALASFGVVVLGAVLANGPVATDGAGAMGLVHGALAAVAYAFMIVLCKKAHVEDGLECSAVQLAAAAVTAGAAIVIQGGQLMPLPEASIAPALVLGLVNGGFGCYLYFSSIGRIPAQAVATCDYIEPLSALLLSAAVLGEGMLPSQWVGALLVIVGAVSCELLRRRASAKRLRVAVPVNG